jgi:excisionase family DNA binding protein
MLAIWCGLPTFGTGCISSGAERLSRRNGARPDGQRLSQKGWIFATDSGTTRKNAAIFWFSTTAIEAGQRTVSALDRLRRLVEVADPDGTVTVRWLAALVDEEDHSLVAPERPSDLTLEEVCEAVKKKPSTVRGWLGRGELRGYKLNGKAWRVPRSALAEYLAKQGSSDSKVYSEAEVDISAWRRNATAPR